MYSAKYVLICSAALLVIGCSAQPIVPAKPVVPEVSTSSVPVKRVVSADSLIAQDFINIMVQIDDLAPWSTELSFGQSSHVQVGNDTPASAMSGEFGKSLRAAAVKTGYVIKDVDSGPNYISFSVTDSVDADDGTIYTYDLSVGEVDFRRVYKPLQDGRIEPHKAMLVRGVDAANLETDDSIFDVLNDDTADGLIVQTANTKSFSSNGSGFDSPVARKDTERRQPFDSTSNIAKNQARIPPVTVELPATLAETSNQPETVAANADGFQTVRKVNIAISGTSNYENLLADKQNVVEEILIFGDDSYVLGERNKKILGEMMGSFNADTDVVSVVGCSTGITKIENGNAALAIGRANRVKEALLYSGIPHDKIYDEGCWSPTPNSTPFPNRGVVITVKRKVDNS